MACGRPADVGSVADRDTSKWWTCRKADCIKWSKSSYNSGFGIGAEYISHIHPLFLAIDCTLNSSQLTAATFFTSTTSLVLCLASHFFSLTFCSSLV